MNKIGEFLTKETAGLPNWAWGLVVVGGAGVGYWFVKKNSSNAAGSTTTSATGATDTSQAGANAVSQPSDTGSIDYGSQYGAGANPGSPVYVLGTSPQPPPPTPPPVTQSITIRQRQTSGPNANYDKNNPGGVPIKQSPSDSPSVGLQPFGSTVQTTGPAVTGGYNMQNNQGSTTWYPVANGYISAWDVVGIGGGGLLRPNKSVTDAMN